MDRHVGRELQPRVKTHCAARAQGGRVAAWLLALVLTIAAYHAGPGAVLKYKGVPPYETTQQYVRSVLKQYYKYKGQGG